METFYLVRGQSEHISTPEYKNVKYDKQLREVYVGEMEDTTKEQVIELEKKKGVPPNTFLNWLQMEKIGGESDKTVINRIEDFLTREIFYNSDEDD